MRVYPTTIQLALTVESYDFQMLQQGGVEPVVWSSPGNPQAIGAEGDLLEVLIEYTEGMTSQFRLLPPAGLSLGADGRITGVPEEVGLFIFPVIAVDAEGTSAMGYCLLVVRIS